MMIQFVFWVNVLINMSRFVEISPVPPNTTVPQLREVFAAYSLNRLAVVNQNAYLEFSDANDIETLHFAFADGKVDQLGGA